MTELIRTPSRQIDRMREINSPYLHTQIGRYKYDYTTPDGRWRIEKYWGCAGGWAVIDTTGHFFCTSCANGRGHATIVRTLDAAQAFIAEWSA